MKLLNRISFAAKTALLDTDPEDTLKAGKHSDAGLIHRLRQEIADLRAGHSPEVDGYKEALRKAAQDLWAAEQEAAKYKAWFGKADNGWRSADAEVQRLRVLLSADAGLPGTEPVPAPVDNGCRDTPATTAETQRDLSLLQLARPGEEHMAAELDAMRASNLTTTVTLPVIPDRPAVADPAEEALNIPAPPPGAGASEISMTAGLAAVTKIAAVVAEAS